MAREQFIDRNFSPGSLAIIQAANTIIADYQAQGFTLTLRQLYYQFVSRDLLKNRQSEYKRLGSIINDARLAGLVDWSSIEDRTRNVHTVNAWTSPASIVRAVAQQYQEDLWRNQDYRPEVWIEKDALLGVIEGICQEWRLPYFACRGYTSQSEAYAAGKRFQAHRHQGFMPVVFHLGDHDPSGLDMTRDNRDRLAMFAHYGVEVRRLALHMSQIEEYGPPPNPAKDTDARFEGYRLEHGDESWELDALEPQVIASLIEEEVESVVDMERWADAKDAENEGIRLLTKVSDNWVTVVDHVRDL